MHGNNDGYATGSKDGSVILWDNGFKPITKLDMVNTPVGYEGDLTCIFVCANLEEGIVLFVLL